MQAMHREATVMPAGMVAAICEITGLPQHSMQDAHECWTAFADCLDSVVLDHSSPWECRFDPCGGSQGANTLGRYCFGSLVRSTLQCQACGHKSLRNEMCLDLQVPLPASSGSHTSCCKPEPQAISLAAIADDTSGRSGLSDPKEQPSGAQLLHCTCLVCPSHPFEVCIHRECMQGQGRYCRSQSPVPHLVQCLTVRTPPPLTMCPG